jgi:tungstate transport system substrate-binding protein
METFAPPILGKEKANKIRRFTERIVFAGSLVCGDRLFLCSNCRSELIRLYERKEIHMKTLDVLLVGLSVLLLASGASAETRLKMATTTSTDNSGLLDTMLPPFEKNHGIEVDVVAVGTGRALKLGENGDVDIVLVHAREAEEEFIEKGFGVNRRDVMYNDFVIVGPEGDPAGIRGSQSAANALLSISQAGASFVSRGDDSGTHKKEKKLWLAADIPPEGAWYVEAGQGMGAVLNMADEKQAYALTDRGTWIALSGKLELTILFEGDPELFNPYGIIAVNPALHPHVNYMEAMLLIAWFTSPEGQKLIADFKKDGQALFVPSTK